ncbi:hypothetical protein COT57_00130 [Candidatus Micrarchaeota archaeon CG09_land_8_20_14_0_10_55_25]|nr:MAG: hypothetical protein COT57_00130 [Candidatus Micrarchaeota archaeon CG09_land_8_20_14_0_10_55_25]
MAGKKLGGLLDYYTYLGRKRVQYFSWKWRVIVILLALSVSAYVYDLLNEKYFFFVEAGSQGAFLLSDKLFSWFMTGFLFGVLALGLLYEGELLVNWRRLFRDVEGGVGEFLGVKPAGNKAKRRPLKKKKRK